MSYHMILILISYPFQMMERIYILIKPFLLFDIMNCPDHENEE